MLNVSFLDYIPIWGIFIISIIIIILAEEIGYRIGNFRSRRESNEGDSRIGGLVGAELGLLALFLAFTFGLASSRFDARRQVFLDETNAIGTAYLRASMLPEPHRRVVRNLFYKYIDIRIKVTQGVPVEEVIRQSESLQEKLWIEAVAAADKDPHSIQTGLFIQALNEVIDLHTMRVTAGLRSRIPTPIWVVLFSIAILSFMAVGYQGGMNRTSRSPAIFLIAFTFAAVIWLLVDLDRPGSGLMQVNQQPMIELRNMMEKSNL